MYRNIVYNPKRQTMWFSDWDENGNRVSREVPFRPYLYMKDQTGTDGISIYGEPLKKYEFDTSWDRKTFCESTKKTYYCLPPEQQFLIDKYWMYPQDEKFSQFPLKVWFFDIEAVSSEGFPDPKIARWPINVMTIYDTVEKRYHVFTTATQYYPKLNNVVVHLYPNDEFGMIKGFVKFWRRDPPDILSGFYSWGFDCPYLFARMRILYNDEDAPSKLSPVGRAFCRDNVSIRLGSEEKTYEQLWTICGVSSIDMQAAYIKFSRIKLASYSLNYVCEHEKVGQKLEHEGSLYDWWVNNPQEFIDYNIQDVALLLRLEEKLRFMELCRAISYSGLCQLEQSLKTLPVIGGLAAIEAMHDNRIISSFDNSSAKVNYEGGYVTEPVPGFHKNILSEDANSMYPNALISFNMSNETKVGKVVQNGKGGFTLFSISGKSKDITKEQLVAIMREKSVACTPNGVLFSQKKVGMLPKIVSRIYSERKAMKKEMLSLEKQIVGMADCEEKFAMQKRAEFLNLRQYLYKILINSLYGRLCEKNFILFDIDIGESITTVGRHVIKCAQKFLDEYATNYCGHEVHTQVYGDTDSVGGDSKIVINGKEIKISDFYDSCGGAFLEKDVLNSNWVKQVPDGVGALCYDGVKACERKVLYVMKHVVKKHLYKISSHNKSVIVTGDHSIVVLRGKRDCSVRVRDIQKTDMLYILNHKMRKLHDALAITTLNFEIEDLGEQERDVYDIEVDGTHNFFANGILVHNSRYFTITELMEHDNQPFLLPNGDINPWVFEQSKKIEDFVNAKTADMLKNRFGCKSPTLSFKTESIAPVGLWTAKKRYIVYCRSDEGVPCDEFHYTGIDIKRSTCPKKIRPIITKVVEEMIRTQDRNRVSSLLDESYAEYLKLPFEEKVISMGCNNISEYTMRGQNSPNGIALHTPRQVACGIQWNNMLKRDGLLGKYSAIHDSEKIQLFYCHDNGDGITSFGFKDKMPVEYKDKYIFDEDTMYKKSVLSCFEKLFEAVGWEMPDPTKGEEDLLSLIG